RAPKLLDRPAAEEGVVTQFDLLGRTSTPAHAPDHTGAGDDTRHDPVPRAFPHGAAEVPRGRRQHQALDPVAMAVPRQLGDRTAERVADGDEALDAKSVGHGGDVVGAVRETE